MLTATLQLKFKQPTFCIVMKPYHWYKSVISLLIIQGILGGTLMGPLALVDFELHKEYISIAKGAKVEAQISRMKEELKVIKTAPEKKPAEIKPQVKEKSEAK